MYILPELWGSHLQHRVLAYFSWMKANHLLSCHLSIGLLPELTSLHSSLSHTCLSYSAFFASWCKFCNCELRMVTISGLASFVWKPWWQIIRLDLQGYRGVPSNPYAR
jgi:hypothetical protein